MRRFPNVVDLVKFQHYRPSQPVTFRTASTFLSIASGGFVRLEMIKMNVPHAHSCWERQDAASIKNTQKRCGDNLVSVMVAAI